MYIRVIWPCKTFLWRACILQALKDYMALIKKLSAKYNWTRNNYVGLCGIAADGQTVAEA